MALPFIGQMVKYGLPLGQLLLGGFGLHDATKKNEEIAKSNEARYQEGLTINDEMMADTMDWNYFIRNNLDQGYGDIRKDVNGGYNQLADQVRTADMLDRNGANLRFDDLYRDSNRGFSDLLQNTNRMYDDLLTDTRAEYGQERKTQWNNYGNWYGEADRLYGDRLNEGMAMLEGLGTQEKADVRQDWKNRESQGVQDMISSGLTGTTIMPTMRAGYEREKNADLARVNERLQNQKLNTYTGLSGDRLDALSGIRNKQLAGDAGWGEALATAVGNIRGTQTTAGADILDRQNTSGLKIREGQLNYNNAMDTRRSDTLLDLEKGRNRDTTKLDTARLLDIARLDEVAKNDQNAIRQGRMDWIFKKEEPYNDPSIWLNQMNLGAQNLMTALTPPPPQPEQKKSGLGALVGGGGMLGADLALTALSGGTMTPLALMGDLAIGGVAGESFFDF